MSRAAAIAVAAACLAAPQARTADLALVERDAYLMGTRASLAAYAPGRVAGLAMLESALEVLESAEAQLSTWRADSDLSRLNRTPIGTPWTADAALCRTFRALYEWHEETGGAFDPGIGALAAAWSIHADGRVPPDEELRTVLRRTGLRRLTFDPRHCTLVRKGEVTMDAGGFGKGEALDRVAAALGPAPWLIDLGGQVMAGGPRPGDRPWLVDVAHPRQRTTAYLQVALASGSISTSGSSERDLTVGTTRVGHILDPRTGRPAPFAGSVTVWHARALAADILSTALYVMGPDAGLPWAEARGLSVCYLIPDERGAVRVVMTDAFQKILQ